MFDGMEIVKFLFMVDYSVYLWYYLRVETRKQINKKMEGTKNEKKLQRFMRSIKGIREYYQ